MLRPWTTSLIPYTYALLDERSGYPAGIRDPEWQDMVLRAAGDPAALQDARPGRRRVHPQPHPARAPHGHVAGEKREEGAGAGRAVVG